jgi:plastocyanin
MGRHHVVAALVAGACSAIASGAIVDVYVYDFAYSIHRPEFGEVESAQIFVGDTVRWVWLNDFHDVVSVPGQLEEWQSPLFSAGDTFEHTFTNAGVYWYYCSPHGFPNADGTASGMASIIEVIVPAPGSVTLLAIGTLIAAPWRRRR